MSFLKRILGWKTHDKKLEGIWLSDMQDDATKKSIGNVRLSFTKDGKLLYDIINSETIQKMNLIYWTSDGFLYSDQPSNPKQERTKYRFDNDGTLILDYRGDITRFKKQV